MVILLQGKKRFKIFQLKLLLF